MAIQVRRNRREVELLDVVDVLHDLEFAITPAPQSLQQVRVGQHLALADYALPRRPLE